jgi:hypothetical protein
VATVVIGAPILTLMAVGHGLWKPARALLNGPILRSLALDGNVLVQEERSFGRHPVTIEVTRIPLDGNAMAMELESAIMLRSTLSDGLVAVLLDNEAFVDWRARSQFCTLLEAAGVVFTNDKKAFTSRKVRR